MPRLTPTSTANRVGFGFPTPAPILVTNRTTQALVEGDVGVLDLNGDDAASLNYIPGDANSVMANMRLAVANDRDSAIYLVTAKQPDDVTSVADNAKVQVHLWARDIKINVENNSGGTITQATVVNLYGNSGTPFDHLEAPLAVTAGSKRLAITSDKTHSLATATSALLPIGLFDGFGFILGQELV